MIGKTRRKAVQLILLFGLVMILVVGGFRVSANAIKFKSNKVVLEVGSSVKNRLLNTKKKQKVKYFSKNKKIATVTKSGKITGKTPGKTKIVAVYNKKKYICHVTVKKKKQSTKAPTTKEPKPTNSATTEVETTITVSPVPTTITVLPSVPVVTSTPTISVPTPDVEKKENYTGIKITYIDVGQADSTLIQCDGYNLLVDCGNNSDEDLKAITSVLDRNNIKELDAVILTHWHEDHVGGFKYLPSRYTIKSVFIRKAYMNDGEYISSTASAVLHSIETNKLKTVQPEAGDKISFGNMVISFIGPVYSEKVAYNPENPNEYDENKNSMAFVIQYGENKFFFGGDTTQEGESDMIHTYADVLSDIDCYHVNHHGSKYSNSYAFIRQMTGRTGTTLKERPFYAIISCGEDNMYYHPHQTVVELLAQAEANIYRTDTMGNVVAVSDGYIVSLSTEGKTSEKDDITKTPYPSVTIIPPSATPIPTSTIIPTPVATEKKVYIGNKNSNIVHTSTCSSLPTEKNRIYFDDLDVALENGYRKCKNCFKE